MFVKSSAWSPSSWETLKAQSGGGAHWRSSNVLGRDAGALSVGTQQVLSRSRMGRGQRGQLRWRDTRGSTGGLRAGGGGGSRRGPRGRCQVESWAREGSERGSGGGSI